MTKATKPRILIVDDTPSNLLTLGAALHELYDVHIATSGEMALGLAQQHRPALILLDVMMPGMDGFETLRRLRAIPELVNLPVIFVTALSDPGSEQQGLALGALDYITKPIQVDVARQRIQNLLEREQLRVLVEQQRDQLKHENQALRAAQMRLRLAQAVFDTTDAGIMVTDHQAAILEVNPGFCRITGYAREAVLGQNPRLLSSGRHPPEFFAQMWQALLQVGHWRGEIWNRQANGTVYAELLSISALRDDQGQTSHYVGVFSDITPQKTHEEALDRIAHYDVLTGLPNRVLLADRLRQAIAQAMRHKHQLAVVFLDLDGFKAVNDTYGHAAGDTLLIEIAKAMKNVLRQCDTLARLGGDEFVAVLGELEDPSVSRPLLQRLLDAASQPVPYANASLRVTASLGVSFYPQAQPIDAEQLLRQADHAMYQAKQQGKARIVVFEPPAPPQPQAQPPQTPNESGANTP
ncbi:MAG: hypothetical protein OHK0048_10760 [Rhodoferax sp.]